MTHTLNSSARVAVVAVLLAVHVVLAIRTDPAHSGDLVRYWQLAGEQGTPAHDYTVEYPIVTFGALRLERAVTRDRVEFAELVVAANLACDVALALVILSEWGYAAGLVYLVGVALLGKLVFDKTDMPVALLATLATVFALRRRASLSGGSLAIATGLKVWPLALAGLLAPSRSRRRIRAYWVALGIVLGAVGVIWIGVAGLEGPIQVATFRHAKGWEIESIPANLARLLGNGDAAIHEQGAWRLRPVPGWVQPVLWAAQLSVVAVATWWGRRRQLLAPAWVAIVAGLLVFSTLLSPQFVLWLLPAAALAWSVGDRALSVLVLGVAALTRLEFGGVFGVGGFDGLFHGAAWSVGQLSLRNLSLVAVLAYSLVLLRPRSRRELHETSLP